MTALVLVAGASLFTASAASKKKVKKAATLVELKSSADSLSYVAGMNATRGLIPYIQQSFQVDTAYMENFLRGYKDALAMGINPKTVAYSAGEARISWHKGRVEEYRRFYQPCYVPEWFYRSFG